MAWQTPKTDWTTNPKNPKSEDFNRIEGNIEFLKTDIGTKKGLIVDAISDMNQPALVTDTHAELANKIRSISSDANAATGDVEKGKTFYAGGAKKTGTLELTGDAATGNVLSGKTFYNNDLKAQRIGVMPNRGAVTITPGQTEQTIPAGYHNGSGKVPAVVFDAAKVLTGTTIAGKTGTMPNRGKAVITPGITNKAISQGYHDGTGYVTGDADLVAANIKKGVNIFGVTGSLAEVPWFYDFSAYTTYYDWNLTTGYITAGVTHEIVNVTGPGWLTHFYNSTSFDPRQLIVIVDGYTLPIPSERQYTERGGIIEFPIYFKSSLYIAIKNTHTSRQEFYVRYTYMLQNKTPDTNKHSILDAGTVWRSSPTSHYVEAEGAGYLLGIGHGSKEAGGATYLTITIDGTSFNTQNTSYFHALGPIRFNSSLKVNIPSGYPLREAIYILD